MPAYLDVAGFKLLSIMPDEDVEALETRYPGWLLSKLTNVSARLDSRLRKRYAVPFESPYPETAKGWLCDLVTLSAYLRRGVDASDAQFQIVLDESKKAEAEILEAADSNTGLFDLPLRSDSTASGISKGDPLVYSESDPYTWTDVQAEEFNS